MPRDRLITFRSGSGVPAAANFELGEPGWNSTDGKLYIKNAAGVMVEVGAIADGSITTEKLAEGIDPIVRSLNDSFISGTRNRIINGAMRIDQHQNGGNQASGFVVDRWNNANSGPGAYANSRRVTTNDPAFNALRIEVTTARPSPAASEFYQVFQAIEGYNAADFAFGTTQGQPITLSFFVASNVTGTHAVSIYKPGANGPSYVATYTINTPNLYEYKTITFPPHTTGGAWASDSNLWGYVIFDLGSGSNFNTTAGAWQAGNFRRTSGCVNLMATVGNYLNITAVQLEIGTQATIFERKLYHEELAACQRYFYDPAMGGSTTHWTTTTFGPNGAGFFSMIYWPVTMRIAPTLTFRNQTYLNATSIVGSSDGLYPHGARVLLIQSTGGGYAFASYNLKVSAEF